MCVAYLAQTGVQSQAVHAHARLHAATAVLLVLQRASRVLRLSW